MSVISKISNSHLLKKNPLLAKNIPDTQVLTLRSLHEMLDKYKMLYIKPTNSCQGKGIIRIERHRPHRVTLMASDNGHTFTAPLHAQKIFRHIQKLRMDRPYLIQQGIDSLTKNHNLFDLRVHLVRWKEKWRIAGIAGRIASEHLIVTNYQHGVEYKPIMNLLKNDLDYLPPKAKKTVEKIHTLSLQAIQIISHTYPKWNEFGIDMGIAQNGRIWIYEVNIHPSIQVFQIFNPNAYQRITKTRRAFAKE
ncbi:YheC/YheD family protein [Baia soyae]|uniref:YheC/D-like protein n=1 Tax=Baia soyae TaxID=1544746 RepID=A0A4R2RXX7_9BACL|nr:YheC/YheD family protein [Baia soyae]TCP69438.1 YheC/D-like protein [Baia soyae]